MSIKNLKKQNQKIDINITEILSEMDPTVGFKLTPFLLKMYKKTFLNEEEKEVPINYDQKISESTRNIKKYVTNIIQETFGYENIGYLSSFSQHLQDKRISNSDITSYTDWSQIKSEVIKADLKLVDKELSKQVDIIYEDMVWLILKPLSFKSSLVYGSNTKWCTSMKNEPNYFYRYSRQGILIYVLNKSNGNKYAFFSSPEEFSVWDQVDNRIDSLESGIPHEILLGIKKASNIKINGTNFSKLSPEELEQCQNYQNKNLSEYGTAVDEVPGPMINMWG